MNNNPIPVRLLELAHKPPGANHPHLRLTQTSLRIMHFLSCNKMPSLPEPVSHALFGDRMSMKAIAKPCMLRCGKAASALLQWRWRPYHIGFCNKLNDHIPSSRRKRMIASKYPSAITAALFLEETGMLDHNFGTNSKQTVYYSIKCQIVDRLLHSFSNSRTNRLTSTARIFTFT